MQAKPQPQSIALQCFVMQHSLSPEIGVHGIPVDNISCSGSEGMNLFRLSIRLDPNEPTSSKWSSTKSIKFKRCRWLSRRLQVKMTVFSNSQQYELDVDNIFNSCAVAMLMTGTNRIFVLISVYHANSARDSSSIQVVWHIDHLRTPTQFAISWRNNS
ncbi:hypothetical protein GQ457_12G027050 [Hibiscus cannabinus]